MALRYLLDEHHRGPLFRYIQRRNLGGEFLLDVVRVGDLAELPLGASDSTIIQWADAHNRILVSADVTTLPRHLADHLSAGGNSQGIFLTLAAPVRDIYDFLLAAAYASEPSEWQNRYVFIP
jgi:hypothetical protein